MSEYQFVEKPLLNQLASMGWQVCEQGAGIPQDPALSLRTSFREVSLKDEFSKAVKAINTLEDGQPWLTVAQLEQLFEKRQLRTYGVGRSYLAPSTLALCSVRRPCATIGKN